MSGHRLRVGGAEPGSRTSLSWHVRRGLKWLLFRKPPHFPGGTWLPGDELDDVDLLAGPILDLQGVPTGHRWTSYRPTRHVGVLRLPDAQVLTCSVHDAQGLHRTRLTVTSARGPFLFSPPTVCDLNLSARSLVAARRPGRARRRKQAGRVALLGSSIATNYWHWLTEVVGDLWFLEQHGIDRSGIDRWVLPFTDLAWQRELLAQLGLAADAVIPRHEVGRLEAAELVVPCRAKSSALLPAWLGIGIKEVLGWSPPSAPPCQRLLISRADAPGRRLLNEDALFDALQPLGFQRHVLTGLSLGAQQELFASARVIVASSGAALTNLLWCQPGTRVIELLTHDQTVPTFPLLARQLGLDLVTVPSGLGTAVSQPHPLAGAELSQITRLVEHGR